MKLSLTIHYKCTTHSKDSSVHDKAVKMCGKLHAQPQEEGDRQTERERETGKFYLETLTVANSALVVDECG